MSKGQFSIVVALYGVADYVDVFIESLVNQTYPFDDLDIIIVDDASVDGSYDKVKVWALKYPSVIRHATKPNGGPASARNAGIDLAKNEWITFCDPDDALEPRYFEEISSFIARDKMAKASMITSRLMVWNEKSQKITDTHALRKKYVFGERLVDIGKEPNYIQLGGACIFLKRDVLEIESLRFDERIRPTFEDAEFIGRYLNTFSRPIVGIVPTARYLYRTRENGSSLVQSGWIKPERYDDVLRYGYLAMLEGLADSNGRVPVWAQNTVLYDIQWYFANELRLNSPTSSLSNEALLIFHGLLEDIFKYIDADTIDNFSIHPLRWIVREALLVRYKAYGINVPRIYPFSTQQGVHRCYVYCFSGDMPTERFEVDGVEVEPLQAKTTIHSFFGENFLSVRMVWLPDGSSVSVWLNNEFVPLTSMKRPGWPTPLKPSGDLVLANRSKGKSQFRKSLPTAVEVPLYRAASGPLERFDAFMLKFEHRIGTEKIVSSTSNTFAAAIRITNRVGSRWVNAQKNLSALPSDRKIIAWANSESMTRKYNDAWVVMDSVGHAGDNGEHFYRNIRARHPEINMWFLLDRSSADWDRLSTEGFRLVEFGSVESIALVLNSKFQISSDAIHDVQYPIDQDRFGKIKSKFVFLQHGVINNDLSKWLNPKDIAMFVTSTRAEYNSIVRDGSKYRFNADQVTLSGLPRFDSLISTASALSKAERNLIVIMPTWRQDLRNSLRDATTESEIRGVLNESTYIREWFGLLNSDLLRQACDASSCEIVFIPHPNLRDELRHLDLPDHVRILQGDESIQDTLASSRLLISDYSSVVFDAALVGSAISYFQFDYEEFFSGKHSYSKGYFDYQADGFGPIFSNRTELESFVVESSAKGFDRDRIYSERVESTFKYFDRDNSERVYQAILGIPE